MRRAVATPCPVNTYTYNEIEDTFSEDTTANLEYTTAFKASFRNVRPKRAPAARHGTANFVIHEDTEEADVFPIAVEHNVKTPFSRLSQPARRVAVAASRRVATGQFISHAKDAQSAGKRHVARVQRSSMSSGEKHGASPVNQQADRDAVSTDVQATQTQEKEPIDRPRRRKTLYIPQEDTMQPTMWMGIFSPVKNVAQDARTENLTGIAAQMAEKRKRSTSSFQPKPKRGPLQANTTAQGKIEAVDQVGAPTGKENLPPGYVEADIGNVKPVLCEGQLAAIDRDAQRRKFLAKARLENLARSKSSSSSPGVTAMYEVGGNRQIDTSPKRVAWNAGPRPVVQSPVHKKHGKTQTVRSPVPTRKINHEPVPVPSRFVRMSLRKSLDINPQVPLLEDIQNPAMYEDNWLEQQEIAVTQILNAFFDQAHSEEKFDKQAVRSKLLEKYNSADNNVLYSKLQSAVMYGSLSLTYEAMLQVQSLVNDIGRKQKFVRFWLENYDHQLLTIALEVVTGRQHAPQPQRTLSPSSKSSNRATLAHFIEASLLRHEEPHFKVAGTGVSVDDLGTKTILKSLMLVKALDMFKENGHTFVEKRLFRCKATVKTSTSAAREVLTMLNTTAGDPTRMLRQLGYTVRHEQFAIDELDYRIQNLAVDFRDGILLTRLVEIMLYGTAAHATEDGTQTIRLSDDEELLIRTSNLRPLISHLKLPCSSRAVKLRNVQLALAALAGVTGLGPVTRGITAEHIVDGFREKTITLLWALVSRFGLAGFIDRNDMVQEIQRLDNGRNINDLKHAHLETGQPMCEYLLKEWARAVAASRGLEVRNFSTSFSDGKVFEAIVDEYEQFLLPNTSSANTVPLRQRLMQLGCSNQFSELFSAREGHLHFFGKDFVMAALAFLCSRVLGPSKVCRKAVIIQRHWRKHWQAVLDERKAIKRELALACAASVTNTTVDRAVGEGIAAFQDTDIWLGV